MASFVLEELTGQPPLSTLDHVACLGQRLVNEYGVDIGSNPAVGLVMAIVHEDGTCYVTAMACEALPGGFTGKQILGAAVTGVVETVALVADAGFVIITPEDVDIVRAVHEQRDLDPSKIN